MENRNYSIVMYGPNDGEKYVITPVTWFEYLMLSYVISKSVEPEVATYAISADYVYELQQPYDLIVLTDALLADWRIEDGK